MGYPFAQVRPSALGTAPDDPTLAEDFESFYAYLYAQIKSKTRLALHCVKGILNMAEAENKVSTQCPLDPSLLYYYYYYRLNLPLFFIVQIISRAPARSCLRRVSRGLLVARRIRALGVASELETKQR